MSQTTEPKKIRIRFGGHYADRYLLAEGSTVGGAKYRVIQLCKNGEIHPIISLIKYDSVNHYWRFLDTAALEHQGPTQRVWDAFNAAIDHKENMEEKQNE